MWNKGLTKEHPDVKKYVREGCEHSQWKGGTTMQSDGYIYIHKEHISPKYYSMLETDGKYVLLHRYLKALEVGRPLNSSEIVHHIDGDKGNNDIGNLELTTRAEHMRTHHPELIRKATAMFKRKKEKELFYLNANGIITAQQAANILCVPHSTIRRRQDRLLLSDIHTNYNGRCLCFTELIDNYKLWRNPPNKRRSSVLLSLGEIFS